MTGATGERRALPVRPGLVWFGAAGGVAAWTLHLGVSYAVVPYVCGAGAEWLLHALTAGLAAVAAVSVAAAWRTHRRLSAWLQDAGAAGPLDEPPLHGPPDDAALARRHNFVAISGVLMSGFFLALILAEGLPALLQADTCRELPTLDRPIVLGAGFLTAGRAGRGAARSRAGRIRRFALAAATARGTSGISWRARRRPAPWSLLHARAAAHAVAVLVIAAAAVLLRPAAAAAHGRVPGPGEAWAAWNWDPWIISVLLLATTTYVLGTRALWRRAGRGRGIPRWRAAAYAGGVAALFLALISPIDALGEALFWVHMVQHLLLMVVAAPLLAVGRPVVAFLWALPPRARAAVGGVWRRSRVLRLGWRGLTFPVTILVLHVGSLWIWHVPGLYEAALASRVVHHLEHASFFFGALLFWWVLAQAGGRGRLPGYGAAVLYVFGTAFQGGLLGALITFAPRPWYTAHAPGAEAWGVDLLVDQQLAGVLMWVPAGLVYAGAGVALFMAWLAQAERTVARRERAYWPAGGADPAPARQLRGGA